MSAEAQNIQPVEPSSLRLVATMGIAGLAAGVLLAGIYIVTRPMILENQWAALQLAVRDVLNDPSCTADAVTPGCVATTRTWVVRDDALVPNEGPEGQLPDEMAVYSAYDSEGQLLGFAVPAEGPGYQDTVKVLYGFNAAEQMIVGLAILENKETPGLGDRIVDDPVFHASFAALAILPTTEAQRQDDQGDFVDIVYVRDGRDEPHEIDVISTATISSEAVVKMINRSAERWVPMLTAVDAEGE